MSSDGDFAESLEYIERLPLNESFWGKKHVALLLDFDGTLAPLADRPELANLTPKNRELLEQILSEPNTTLAVISGRQVDDVKAKMGFPQGIFAGNHGYEIHFPDGFIFTYQFTDETMEAFKKMVWDLNAISRDGAWVEDKKFSLTFHYRQVPVELHQELINTATQIIRNRGFTANPAHMAVEAKAPIKWNKGYAADYILKKRFGDNWPQEVNAIFMGDDATDEDAMAALKGKALTFRVTSNPQQPTHASYRIPSTDTVTLVLEKVKKRLRKEYH